jgi:hypothetical protein
VFHPDNRQNCRGRSKGWCTKKTITIFRKVFSSG